MQTNQIITGNCLNVLRSLPDNAVDMCMTSPPYWQLRDYNHEDQLGLEETPREYIANIAEVCDEIERVLTDSGSLWLNLGDTYENKDKQLIPHRTAVELQSRGWICRNDVTWHKPDPMPSSATDRLNCVSEMLFHFTKEKQYWYDLDEIREEHAEISLKREKHGFEASINRSGLHEKESMVDANAPRPEQMNHPEGKNPGDVFEIPTTQFPDAHFAVYPKKLCEKPIKATCPPNGIVLDPFAGAGTTLLKAKELDRDFLGIELNPEYADMARARVGLDVHDPSHVRKSENQSGLEIYQ